MKIKKQTEKTDTTTTQDDSSTAAKTEVLEIVQGVDAPALFSGKEKAEALVKDIQSRALSIVADADTPAGRKELKSAAYALARCKTTLDDMGKDMVAELKQQAAAVDEVRRYIRTELDSTKEKVLLPVTVWEHKVRAVDDHLTTIRDLGTLSLDMTADAMARRLEKLQDVLAAEIDPMGRADEIAAAVTATNDRITAAIAERRKQEEEQQELARLRAEKAERDAQDAARRAAEERKEREAAIAQQAAERATQQAAERIRQLEEDRARLVQAENRHIEEKSRSSENEEKGYILQEIADSILELDGLAEWVDEDKQVGFADWMAQRIFDGEIAWEEVVG